MNEQTLEQSEEVLILEVSDEALEAAAGNELGGPTGVAWTADGAGRCCG